MRLIAFKIWKWPFQNSLKVNSVSFVISKHFQNKPFVYNFLKFEITWWSIGCNIGVVLGGRKLTWIRSNYLTKSSSKTGGWAGALSSNRMHFNGNQFSRRYFFTLGPKTSCIHSVKNASLWVFALHITGNLSLIRLFLHITGNLSLIRLFRLSSRGLSGW